MEVLVLGDLLIPGSDLGLYPVVELLPYHGAGDVDDELLRQPPQLLLIWEIDVALWMHFDEITNLSYAKPIILGHEGVFQALAFDDYKRLSAKDMDLHFFYPASRSFRKYTLI